MFHESTVVEPVTKLSNPDSNVSSDRRIKPSSATTPLMTLRANDADDYKSWLALGIEELGRDVAAEVESEWMVPLLVEEERARLMAWQLGVSL